MGILQILSLETEFSKALWQGCKVRWCLPVALEHQYAPIIFKINVYKAFISVTVWVWICDYRYKD